MFSIFVAFMFTSDPTIKATCFSFAAGVFLTREHTGTTPVRGASAAAADR